MLNNKKFILFLNFRYILSLEYLLLKMLVFYNVCILFRFFFLTQDTAAI